MPIPAQTARLLLGLVFVATGIDGSLVLLGYEPIGPTYPGAVRLVAAMQETGYLAWLHRFVELAAGLLLLSNNFVPLALVILAPITVNICGLAVLRDQSAIPVATIVLVFHLYLALVHRKSFSGVLERKPRY
jgi:uncharacterized membrane protein YphA (DoxX/SURF4 family)